MISWQLSLVTCRKLRLPTVMLSHYRRITNRSGNENECYQLDDELTKKLKKEELTPPHGDRSFVRFVLLQTPNILGNKGKNNLKSTIKIYSYKTNFLESSSVSGVKMLLV
ncbi:hypothetical protein Hanom_Chr08g00687861 [Helianthus anomalus]